MKKFLLPILIGSYLNVNSQVYSAGAMFSMYYDINPDTLINYSFPYTTVTYDLNLFDDPSNNIALTAHGAASSGGADAYIKVTSLNPNVCFLFGRLDSVYVTGNSNWSITKIAKPLNLGDPINAVGGTWDNSTLYLTDHTSHSGGNKNVNDWIGGDKYIGLKYQNGSTITYGWIRVQCITKDSCYIKDFSYSPTVLAVNELNNEEKVSVYPNPSSGIFAVSMRSKAVVTKICVYDVLGNCLWNKDCRNDASPKINLSSQPKGIYFLETVSDGERAVKKIVLQ